MFERVKKLVGLGSEDDEDSGSTGVVMPTDSAVIKKTAKRVDLSRGDVKEAVENFQKMGAMAYPAIDERAVGSDEKGSGKMGEEGPSFIYAIYEDDDVLVVGGAKSTIVTFAGRLNLSNTETEAVTTANRIAADMNGFSEHTVMDDIFLVPKKKTKTKSGSFGDMKGETEEDEEEEERVRELEENGFRLDASEVFDSPPDVEDMELFGVSYGCEDGAVEVTLKPEADDEEYHAVVKPNGDLLIPPEIAVGLGVGRSDVDWQDKDGKVIGRMKNGTSDEEVENFVRTSLSRDNIEGEIQAHLPDSHAAELGVEDGDEASLHLEPDDGSFAMVLTPDSSGEPSDASVKVRDIGTGTDMLCFALPEEMAVILGVEDDDERQVEWGMRGNEMVGSVVQ